MIVLRNKTNFFTKIKKIRGGVIIEGKKWGGDYWTEIPWEEVDLLPEGGEKTILGQNWYLPEDEWGSHPCDAGWSSWKIKKKGSIVYFYEIDYWLPKEE